MTKAQTRLLFAILRLVLLYIAREDRSLGDRARSLDREIDKAGEDGE